MHSVAVAICWGVSASVHAGIHPLGLGTPRPGHPPRYGSRDLPTGCGPGDAPARPVNLPLGVGLEIPPWPDPSTPPPLGVGLETPPGQTPQPTPLGVGLETPLPLARPLNAPPGVGLEDTAPCEQNS